MDWLLGYNEEEENSQENLEYIKCRVYTLKLSTGVVRERNTDLVLLSSGEPDLSSWTEGDFALDCYRHLFFELSADQEFDDGGWGFDCTQHEYKVVIESAEKRILFYKEFDL